MTCLYLYISYINLYIYLFMSFIIRFFFICIVSASGGRSDWSILHRVYGLSDCPCCLRDTAYVQDCLVKYASCGNSSDKFCNCDQQDPTCLATYEESTSPAQDIATEVGRRLLAGGGGTSTAGATCLGDVTVSLECPEGQMPALSFLALNQVHLFIFTIAVIHVLCGFLVYLAAWARLHFQWKRWSSEDDPHAVAVRAKLEVYYAALQAGPGSNIGAFGTGNTTTAPPTNQSSASTTKSPRNSVRGVARKVTAARYGTLPDPELGESREGLEKQEPSLKRQRSSMSIVRMAERLRATYLPEVLLRTKSGSEAAFVAVEHNFRKRFLEYCKCLILGLNPAGVISHDKYAIMKASYVYTHKLGPTFGFLDHVQRNLEDDISHIVGLSVEFWGIITIFVLVSGPYGYAVMPFMCAIGGILVLTNGKIVSIAREVTQHGGAGRLSSKVFWFNRPQLLLIPIKLGLFFCSFIYASFLFFVWQFGKNSCPFTDAFYPGWALPWWTIILFNTIIFFHMGTGTMPAYSLVVLMGSDIKAHMLPKKFTKKLLAVAAAAKERVKADKADKAASLKLSKTASKEKISDLDQSMDPGAGPYPESEVELSSSNKGVHTPGVDSVGTPVGKGSEISEAPLEGGTASALSSLGASPASEAPPSGLTEMQERNKSKLRKAAGRTTRKVLSSVGRRLVGHHDHHHDDDDLDGGH